MIGWRVFAKTLAPDALGLRCLSNALRLDSYIQDAERAGDTEVADLFRKAQADSRKGAELGKDLLRARLGGG